jgi:branched-chain amino acid transport system ATP-binding protein
MLSISGLNVSYNGIHALKGISLNVPEGKIVSLVGANGAGKSTLLRTICGLVPSSSGSINFLGKEITRMPAHKIAREGLALVPEGRKVFAELSIYENLLMGAFARKDKEQIKKDVDWVYNIFPRLKERSSQTAMTLSGGEQQMLAVGRALTSRPKMILLDEPSLGLAPLLIKEVFRVICQINDEGTTILLIEQNAMAALHIADYGYVMETGTIVLEGTGKDLLNDSRVKEAYLGESVS